MLSISPIVQVCLVVKAPATGGHVTFLTCQVFVSVLTNQHLVYLEGIEDSLQVLVAV